MASDILKHLVTEGGRRCIQPFLAPLLLWIGSALFAWRLSTQTLVRGRRAMARLARPFAHGLSGVVAASMSRQRRLLSRGLMIMALTGSFAVSTAVFFRNGGFPSTA